MSPDKAILISVSVTLAPRSARAPSTPIARPSISRIFGRISRLWPSNSSTLPSSIAAPASSCAWAMFEPPATRMSPPARHANTHRTGMAEPLVGDRDVLERRRDWRVEGHAGHLCGWRGELRPPGIGAILLHPCGDVAVLIVGGDRLAFGIAQDEIFLVGRRHIVVVEAGRAIGHADIRVAPTRIAQAQLYGQNPVLALGLGDLARYPALVGL